MQVPLCLDNLGELDEGAARAIIDAAIRQAVADMDDRGEDGKPRQVNIALILNRLDNGLIAAHIEAEAKIPRRKTAGTLGVVKSQSGTPTMLYQTMAPDEPNQRTIDELDAGDSSSR